MTDEKNCSKIRGRGREIGSLKHRMTGLEAEAERERDSAKKTIIHAVPGVPDGAVATSLLYAMLQAVR